MALHPFPQLAQEYSDDWAHMVVINVSGAMTAAQRLVRDVATYRAVETATAGGSGADPAPGVPAIWLMPTNEREDGGRLDRYLGNGDLLTAVTKDVPRGRGPFPGPHGFVDGAKDALHLDGIDRVTDWSVPRALFEWELWNGWGYRAHGVRSPYLWGGTNLQQDGKYIADGVWDAHHRDEQLGCAAIMWALMRVAPDLALDHQVPVGHVPILLPVPSPAPVTVGGSHHDTKWLQLALNHIADTDAQMHAEIIDLGGPSQLDPDGAYGRQTRLFVRAFETTQHLDVDRGFAGPQVLGALDKILGSDWVPPAA